MTLSCILRANIGDVVELSAYCNGEPTTYKIAVAGFMQMTDWTPDKGYFVKNYPFLLGDDYVSLIDTWRIEGFGGGKLLTPVSGRYCIPLHANYCNVVKIYKKKLTSG